MSPGMRTSLSRAPSGFTADQLRERADQVSRDAWQANGFLVISAHDARLNWTDIELLRQIARKLGYGEYRGNGHERKD